MARRSAGYRKSRSSPWLSLLLAVLFFVFLSGGVYSGYLFYSTLRDIVANIPFPSLPHLPVISAGVGGEQRGTQPDWAKKERVNILLLGIDRRKGEQGPWRTDTIIVVTVDPNTLTGGMLSIPRDLYVPIPGFGENRINTAYFYGDGKKYPGGGPALAKKTVQYNLGVPIHYYVTIDFEGFRQIVDALGGLDIYVEKEIRDDKYPDEAYGYAPIYIPAGMQHLDGERALQYARTRHGGSDFERAKRQQQVLLAVRDKALSLNLLPKLPALIKTMGHLVQTDLQPNEIVTLARIGAQIKPEHIKYTTIDSSMTVPLVTSSGASVLWPDREKIRQVVDDIFTSPVTPTPPPPPVPDRMIQEAARIMVENGTLTEGLAQRTSDYLKEQGFNVVGFGNADRFDYGKTIIVDYTAMTYTIQRLADLFHVAPENIRRSPNLRSEIDIRLILGRDFELPTQ